MDARGMHRASCTESGRLKRRAAPTKQALALVCREAGAVGKCNAYLKDMNLGIDAADQHRIEVLAQGVPLRAGSQLAIDIALRAALTTDCQAKLRAAVVDTGRNRGQEGTV